ncbi:hypothetical protein PFISCL1PPCAC_16031, partial [Pristionchus fissidentatus]
LLYLLLSSCFHYEVCLRSLHGLPWIASRLSKIHHGHLKMALLCNSRARDLVRAHHTSLQYNS